jgi:outer membrane immunogenic protein
MKLRLIAGIALLAAAAGSGPDPACAQGVPVYSWTGCYVGLAGGGSWGSSKHTYEGGNAGFGLAETNDFSLSGGIFGGTAGSNVQKGLLAFGAENDISWTNNNGSAASIPPFSTLNTFQTKQTWLDTLRVRAGLAWNQWFFYGTGGLGFGGEGITTCGPLVGCGSQSKVATAWTAGVGTEFAFWRAWSLKLEYLHVDFGSETFAPTPVGSVFFAARNVTLTNDIVRAGVNYSFSLP